ncbi:amidohydrolase 2 [Meredithblackwellia eburnea MCA 4105]
MSKRIGLKLDPSAFVPAPVPQRRTQPSSLIDTHIHLFTQSQLDKENVVWPRELPQDHQLNQPHELGFYKQVTDAANQRGLTVRSEGFVYVQAEAKHDDTDQDGTKGGWDSAIDEVDSVCQAALSVTPPKLLALVPWAPVHHGAKALEAFVARINTLPSLLSFSLADTSLQEAHQLTTGARANKVRGFRYLLQDSPAGFALQDEFIEGLKWLGEHGYTFDMTLDAGPNQLGPSVLEEAIEVISKVQQGQEEGKETKFILDHFAKPDLQNDPTVPPLPNHAAYITAMFSVALLPNVYLKLSGLLDSAAPSLVAVAFEEYRQLVSHIASLKRRILTFLEPALEAFGDSRIVIGSDWPMFRAKTVRSNSVDTRDIEEEAEAYAFQLHVYRQCLVDVGLDGEGLDRVFGLNAKEFYGI